VSSTIAPPIIEATAFRDNIPAWNDEVGRGLEIEDWPEAGERASVTIRTSAFERHHFAALSAFSAELTIEGTLIRDTAGRGLGISSDPFTLLPSTAVVRWCSLERNQIAGTIIVGSHAEFQGTRIVDTAPHPDTGVHGDGLVALYDFVQQPQIELVGSSIERSARAGIASFAGFVRVESSSLECNAIAMNGQNLGEVSFEFEDGSGNSCGCGQARDQCKVLSQSLEPPEPLDPGS